MSAPTTITRGRTRRMIQESASISDEKAQIKVLIPKVVEQNKAANAAKNLHDKTRKTLYDLMKKYNVKMDSVAVDGKLITAEIKCSEVVTIDVAKLKKLVDDKTFMAIISATKGAVEEYAGKIVAEACTTRTDGNENVTVK